MIEQKLLLVDDQPANLVSLEAILEDEGRTLLKAESGQEALKILLKEDVSLVLLDVQMPGMDGFEVAELMRQRKDTQTIPIIFVTAISKEKKYVFKGYQAGAVDYLFKPLDPLILKSKVNFFLELDRQRRELQVKLKEAQARFDQASRALDLASRELSLTRPLLSSGAVSEVEVLRLERDVSNARGERNQASAQVARLQAAIEEADSKLREASLELKNRWSNELSETLGQLAALEQSNVGLQDKVAMAEIRSPVDGIVQRLHVTTLGGVVQPGQDIVEIVPNDEQLLVEARIAPQDIAFLRPGQSAFVKFTAYDFATYGGMQATLEHISADTITDDDNNTFYLVRVRTQDNALGPNLTIIPGMTAQVDIRTGKRTVLDYLLKPLLRAKGNALSER